MKRSFSDVMACVGAMIGAGFASGREIVTFFTRYGLNSWWLMLLSVAVMTLLCMLCMRAAVRYSGTECWCAMLEKKKIGAKTCMALLLTMVGGAMISAAGQMVMFLWPSEWAYSLGVVVTLLLAWGAGFGQTRIFGWIGSGLICLFLVSVLWVLRCIPAETGIVLQRSLSITALLSAAVRATGYAAMNMALSIGMVCRCAGASTRETRGKSVLFGMMMAALLCISNTLYMQHPSLLDAPFPIVPLLATFGRRGFVASVGLLYLSIFTTLIAVLYALRCMVKAYVRNRCLQSILTMGLPLGLSAVGFAGIVDAWYAPAGIICMLLVFLPLAGNVREARNA